MKKNLDLHGNSVVALAEMRNEKEKMTKIKHFNPMKLREKYSIGSLNKKNNYSSFWLNDGWDNNSSIFDDVDGEPIKKGVDLIALSSYRRAISNFVSIVTGKTDIKVTFETSGDSYTDGKNVTISSKLDDKLFDSTVGLALHEGSHILLSDFDFLKDLEHVIPKEYFIRGEKKGYSKTDIKVHIKNLLNYVEDRRIDYFVFTNSPGYKGYYHSMYDKYFHSRVIDKALKTDEMTSTDWDSYIFRILNLTNKNSNLDAVPGLRDIYFEVFKKNGGVKNIKSTADAFKIALNIYDIILNNIPDGTEKVDSDTGEVTYERADGKSGDATEGGSGGDGSGDDETKKLSDEEFKDLLDAVENDNLESGSGSGDGTTIDTGDTEMTSDSDAKSTSTSNNKKVELTENQKKQLANAIKKQKKFMDGDTPKKKLSKKDKAAIDSVESSGMKYVDVAGDVTNIWNGNKTPTKVILVKKFTKALADSETIGMLRSSKHSYGTEEKKVAIEKGLVMGTILGKKLQVRGESRDTKWTRKDTGRIDKRLIAELGFGNNRVFSTTFVESYSNAFLHISVDASGSMGGSKWINTITVVSAIAKACSMINNVDLVISFRTTEDGSSNRCYGRRSRNMNYPLMLIAYDSRVDKISKVRNLFPYLISNGTTPEGLCFEAVMKEIEPTSKDKDSYFLNFSDGMPMFSNDDIDYNHDTAIDHTKKMVDKIRDRGVKVLSYFIGDSYDRNRGTSTFTRMYGKDAHFIDVTSVLAVAKTMNKKFLQK